MTYPGLKDLVVRSELANGAFLPNHAMLQRRFKLRGLDALAAGIGISLRDFLTKSARRKAEGSK